MQRPALYQTLLGFTLGWLLLVGSAFLLYLVGVLSLVISGIISPNEHLLRIGSAVFAFGILQLLINRKQQKTQ